VVDHQLTNTHGCQTADMPFDQRPATGQQQGFGRVVGQRAHALATPGRQNHRFHAHAISP
jgi:hypothetical protein